MMVVAIIAEWNPFHRGHAYLIKKAREMTNADYCIVILSGNYVQRGEPAIFAKTIRVKSGLLCGADLILELPFAYSCSSAEFFAGAAVALADKLGVVDYLVFGSESGDIKKFNEYSGNLFQETDDFRHSLKASLKKGLSFPAAREAALSLLHPNTHEKSRLFLKEPNNILGLEYCKALRQRKSYIEPLTLKRKGEPYHSHSLQSTYSSASALRKEIRTNGVLPPAGCACIPDILLTYYENELRMGNILSPEDYFPALLYKLSGITRKELIKIQDISEDFADKLLKYRLQASAYGELCRLLKSKDITYGRISRSMMHLLFSLKKEDMNIWRDSDYSLHARILGFRKNARPLLSSIRKNADIPIISKTADAKYLLRKNELKLFLQARHADSVYHGICAYKAKRKPINEYQLPVVIV